jgi:hypothetical protein
LGYGSFSLWNGRPLYYVFSEKWLQMVQAYDVDPAERLIADRTNAEFAPRWYSMPRWVSAAAPKDPGERAKLQSAGADLSQMPRYFQSFEAGLPLLQMQLRKIDDIGYFILYQRDSLKRQMQALHVPLDQANCLALTGRGGFLLVVFDSKPKLVAILKP